MRRFERPLRWKGGEVIDGESLGFREAICRMIRPYPSAIKLLKQPLISSPMENLSEAV